MFTYILLILIAWFVQMPLWLSIVATVVAGCELLEKIFTWAYKIAKAGGN